MMINVNSFESRIYCIVPSYRILLVLKRFNLLSLNIVTNFILTGSSIL